MAIYIDNYLIPKYSSLNAQCAVWLIVTVNNIKTTCNIVCTHVYLCTIAHGSRFSYSFVILVSCMQFFLLCKILHYHSAIIVVKSVNCFLLLRYKREFGFTLSGRRVFVDDIRVRATGHSQVQSPEAVKKAEQTASPIAVHIWNNCDQLVDIGCELYAGSSMFL